MEKYWMWNTEGEDIQRKNYHTGEISGLNNRKGRWEVSKLGDNIQDSKTLCRNILGTLNQFMSLLDSKSSNGCPSPLE